MEALGLSCGSRVSQLGLQSALKTVARAQFRVRICTCHFWQPNFAKDPRKIRERTAKDAMSQVHPSTWKAPCFWQFNLTLVCGIEPSKQLPKSSFAAAKHHLDPGFSGLCWPQT